MKTAYRLLLSEPYRLFFPLGMIAGIWGVLMWPMLYAGWLSFYPAEAHTRMMIEGFMGAFVIGFIGTAYPRLTGSRAWTTGEFLTTLILWLMSISSHAMGKPLAGDAAFAGLLGILFIGITTRWLHGRRDIPPPGFILLFPAILGAIVSAWMLSRPVITVTQMQWAKLWLFQAFLLFPLMGIAPYLIPRFFGHESSHAFDTSRTPPNGWWKKAFFAALAGLIIIASFAIEIQGRPILAHSIRGLTILSWFLWETPILRKALVPSTSATAIRWAVISTVAGFACIAIWPAVRVGVLHLFFASGVALATLAVGTRVILGHANRHDLLQGKIIWLRWVIGLLILASTTRLSADLIPNVQISHYIYAAWSWAIGGALWIIAVFPYLFRNDKPSERPSNCPRRKRA